MKGAPDVLIERVGSYWSPGGEIHDISVDQRPPRVAENERMAAVRASG